MRGVRGEGLKRYFYCARRETDNFGQVAVKIVNGAYIYIYIHHACILSARGPSGPIRLYSVCACARVHPLLVLPRASLSARERGGGIVSRVYIPIRILYM